MKLYHVTTPERAKAILEEGFDENKNPNYHSKLYREDEHRTFLCRKRNIPLWIGILSEEQKWDKVSIVVVQIPKEKYRWLRSRDPWNEETRRYEFPYIWDWGNQLVIDTQEPLKEGMFGIHIYVGE